jgi:protein involved in temperature-dependent protein secretion
MNQTTIPSNENTHWIIYQEEANNSTQEQEKHGRIMPDELLSSEEITDACGLSDEQIPKIHDVMPHFSAAEPNKTESNPAQPEAIDYIGQTDHQNIDTKADKRVDNIPRFDRRNRLEARYAGYKAALSEDNWTKLLTITREDERSAYLELVLTMPTVQVNGNSIHSNDPQTRLLEEALANLSTPAKKSPTTPDDSPATDGQLPTAIDKHYTTLIWQLSLLNEQLADYFQARKTTATDDALQQVKLSNTPLGDADEGVISNGIAGDLDMSSLRALETQLKTITEKLATQPAELTRQAGKMGTLLVETITTEVGSQVASQVASFSQEALTQIEEQIGRHTTRMEQHWKRSGPVFVTRPQLNRGVWAMAVLIVLTIGLAAISTYLYADRSALRVDARKYAYVRYRAFTDEYNATQSFSSSRHKPRQNQKLSGQAFKTVWQETETAGSNEPVNSVETGSRATLPGSKRPTN